jgi:hypothetical protein
MNLLPSEDKERVFFLTYAPWIDHELPPINRLEIGTEMNSGMPVKHGIYGLAKRMFAD